jgi:hypothetical protein
MRTRPRISTQRCDGCAGRRTRVMAGALRAATPPGDSGTRPTLRRRDTLLLRFSITRTCRNAASMRSGPAVWRHGNATSRWPAAQCRRASSDRSLRGRPFSTRARYCSAGRARIARPTTRGIAIRPSRAADFLVAAQDADGAWREHASPLVRPGVNLYDARTAWGVAEIGKLTGRSQYTEAAVRNLDLVCSLQHENGWFPNCCTSDDSKPCAPSARIHDGRAPRGRSAA